MQKNNSRGTESSHAEVQHLLRPGLLCVISGANVLLCGLPPVLPFLHGVKLSTMQCITFSKDGEFRITSTTAVSDELMFFHFNVRGHSVLFFMPWSLAGKKKNRPGFRAQWLDIFFCFLLCPQHNTHCPQHRLLYMVYDARFFLFLCFFSCYWPGRPCDDNFLCLREMGPGCADRLCV